MDLSNNSHGSELPASEIWALGGDTLTASTPRRQMNSVRPLKSFELFAGAGGLGLGTSRAGFNCRGVLEWNADACSTLRHNQRNGLDPIRNWEIHQTDARKFDFKPYAGQVDFVTGGPPCQPFSMGGKHQAFLDPRDMFPQAVRSVLEIHPPSFVFENVRGLVRAKFRNYLAYIMLRFEFPEALPKKDEEWMTHFQRLEKLKTSGRYSGLRYNVIHRVLNAADYGIPQKRERVFIVGFRSDLNVDWSFPQPTHSEEALLRDQFVTSCYWDRHNVGKKLRPPLGTRIAARIERLSEELFSSFRPWKTVRDAIGDLPEPCERSASAIPNHVFQPGARAYTGHTGSYVDLPAKTLKAGDHGVPGGENMLLREDGTVRYFSIRESARLQTFPDRFQFNGSWTESMRQLGNAVPVDLAHVVAKAVHERLRARLNHHGSNVQSVR